MYINLRDMPLIIGHDGTVEESVTEWISWLLRYKLLSRTTVNGYVNSLNQFYEFLQFHKCEFNSDREIEKIILNYRDDLLNGNPELNWEPHSASSVSRAMNTLCSYLEFIGMQDVAKTESNLSRFAKAAASKNSFFGGGFIKPSKLARMSMPKTKNKFAVQTRHEVKRVKYFPPTLFWDFINSTPTHRDRALFMLMAGTSARVGQALNLWVEDIDLINQKVTFIDPRDSKRRIELQKTYNLEPDYEIQSKGPLPSIWLPGVIKDAFFSEVQQYIEKEYIPIGKRAEMHPYFFHTNTGNRLMPHGVRQRFTRTASKLGLNLSPHSLRHLYGYVSYVVLKIPLEVLMHCMGHSNIESTRVYATIPNDVAEEEFRRALKEITEKPSHSNREKAGLTMLAES